MGQVFSHLVKYC